MVAGDGFLATVEEVESQWGTSKELHELWDKDKGGYVVRLVNYLLFAYLK